MPKNDKTGHWETYGGDLGNRPMTQEEWDRWTSSNAGKGGKGGKK